MGNSFRADIQGLQAYKEESQRASLPKRLFGLGGLDIPTGRLFYTTVADMKQGSLAAIKEWKITINNQPRTLKEACCSDRVDLHFNQDMQGELYILTKADGKIYKLAGAT